MKTLFGKKLLLIPLMLMFACSGLSPESVVETCDELVKDGKVNEAILEYQKAIHTDPSEPVYYLNQAALLRKTKKYANAIRNYEVVLEMNPKSHWPYVGLGRVYRLQKNYDKAKEILNEGLDELRNNAAIYFQLGRVSMDMKIGDEAVHYFDEALSHNYKFMHKVYLYRGEVFETLLNEIERAKLDYQSYLMMEHTDDKGVVEERLKKLDGSNYQF